VAITDLILKKKALSVHSALEDLEKGVVSLQLVKEKTEETRAGLIAGSEEVRKLLELFEQMHALDRKLEESLRTAMRVSKELETSSPGSRRLPVLEQEIQGILGGNVPQEAESMARETKEAREQLMALAKDASQRLKTLAGTLERFTDYSDKTKERWTVLKNLAEKTLSKIQSSRLALEKAKE
jgi:hypothetical protein